MGTTDVMFIRPPDRGTFDCTYSLSESLGIESLCAILRQYEISCNYLDLEFSPLSVDELGLALQRYRPKILGISINFAQAVGGLAGIGSAIDILDKKPLVIAGGQHASLAPDTILRDWEWIDAISLFEAEGTIVDNILALLRNSESALFPNMVFRNGTSNQSLAYCPTSHNLDSYPFPWRPPGILKRIKDLRLSVSVEGSRGCWWGKCGYCALASAQRGDWRPKSTSRIAKELCHIIDQHDILDFTFVDAEFLGPPRNAVSRANAILDEFQELPHRPSFSVNLRPENVRLETLEPLKSAGMSLVYVGLESASSSQLLRWGRGTYAHLLRETVDCLSRAEIPFRAGFILFDRETSLSELHENLTFLMDYPVIEPALLVKGMLNRDGMALASLARNPQCPGCTQSSRTYSIDDSRVAYFVEILRQHLAEPLFLLHKNTVLSLRPPKIKTQLAIERRVLKQLLPPALSLLTAFRESDQTFRKVYFDDARKSFSSAIQVVCEDLNHADLFEEGSA